MGDLLAIDMSYVVAIVSDSADCTTDELIALKVWMHLLCAIAFLLLFAP